MSAKYSIVEADTSDAHAIASLFSLSWTSPFTQLQFGHVDPATLAEAMAPRIESHMKKDGIKFIVARQNDLGTVAAVAQWSLPRGDPPAAEKEETTNEKKERQQFEDDAYRNRLPETSNKDLIMEFTVGLRDLREKTLSDRKHFLLENIATHPDHRGQGLASQLIEWVFPFADSQRVEVYLDTASDNQAMRLYKRLGFEERGNNTIEDLSKFGGEGSETHVALVRPPKTTV